MSIKTTILAMVIASVALPALAVPHIHRGPTAHRVTRHQPRLGKKFTAPRAMDSSRATEIQTALVRTGYLAGAPSGVWDSTTQTAMQKYQSDNGWQTKLTPDARAIIKLGLGSSTTPAAAWVNAPADTSSQNAAADTSSAPTRVQSDLE
jgi:hypothetical protein